MSFLFYYLKKNSKSKNTSKAARYSPVIVGSAWIWWTIGGSVLVLGYPITGALFDYQIFLIIAVFLVLFSLVKLFEHRDVAILDLKKALKDAEDLNHENFSKAIDAAQHDDKDFSELIYPIAGIEPHKEALKHSIENAKQRVLVLSGWATSYVIDEVFISDVLKALGRGVEVYIGFGYQNSQQKEKPQHEKLGKAKLRELHKKCVEMSLDEKLSIFELPNHAKILIKDSDYFICGSFNWLSNKSGRNYERSWVVKIPELVEEEFADLLDIMQKKRLEERREFLKRFVDWEDEIDPN